ncbi:MAG: hypothetical protein HY051_00345 [Candidatus Aenigmarchaeota archaeon]|nr:hypothetical protein [Candidatus Aenigmarchaeota archaeon]
MTKSTQGVYLRRLGAQRHRTSMLNKIGDFKRENVYPKFTLMHAAWKEENIAELKKRVYPKLTQAHAGYKPKLLPSFTKQGRMNWKKWHKKSYLDKIAYAEGRLKKEELTI